ncbi:LacI family DNA-binding transcriptional regulator [Paenibacillus radicis (ex Xue et al. 2023)]|uniref:LacI family transcriptional regulator n=1 Tax=Paenibacillus radicis (ex Xue et al. 2023) TaxID=2972489 RepID=A0ABT1YKX7_9BACL|nr:LacI family DNA-binding transcriptional regulator [Paenibacillus radicis (ex Xue et al. 2023)]MCR8633843.1 LacI family transcriptional regulator [Paenibacillus radicis (ex Xue et al. 2023)]
MATIRDVAKLAGVSVATVSRVINQSGYVNKQTEDKIMKSMRELQYTPNTLARGLANKKTDSIALIIPNITNPFFPELVQAVEDAANRYGYTLLLGNSYNNEENALQYIHIFKNRFVDGVLIFASHQFDSKDLSEIDKIEIPTFVIDKALDNNQIFSAKNRNFMGATMAVEHLQTIGCRHIAHIRGPEKLFPARERFRGYQDALEKTGDFNPSYVENGDFSMESGVEATLRLLDKHPEIDGIFAANDLMAVGSLKALQRQGKKVPDQVALIGYDGIQLLQMFEPEISTIAIPIYDIGNAAVSILIDLINGKENRFGINSNIMDEFEVKLIQRATTTK